MNASPFGYNALSDSGCAQHTVDPSILSVLEEYGANFLAPGPPKSPLSSAFCFACAALVFSP